MTGAIEKGPKPQAPANVKGSTTQSNNDKEGRIDKFESVRPFFENKLSKKDLFKLEGELRKRFPLSKAQQVFKKRIHRRGCAKSSGLSNTQKKAIGLYNLSRTGLLYEDLIPLHNMWNSYMENYLGLRHLKDSNTFGDVTSPNYDETMQQLWKADYHGAYIKVSKSTCPSLVGVEGILVFETRNMLKLLGKDNILRNIPKMSCEFKLRLGDYELSFLGKNFMVRSSDRSIKKLKGMRQISLFSFN
ncbi:ribonuclease P protein subunit p29 isoform X2 [Cimex lectularius]|uniref:Ribonuclease P protein subunit p29 n=1 Tax=Cimex lectularius TaxID=79782 RepID=A0A8I6RJX5_CIMLE|nr:ribonuclease P protein subunit p29 isoform X2 [Cimex lectularius]